MAELTNKQLKEQKKLEKAAKRAAAKSGQAGATAGPADQPQQQPQQQSHTKTTSQLKKQLISAKLAPKTKRPPMFGHLETSEQRMSTSSTIEAEVHPSILSLTLKMSTYQICGSINRCRGMMQSFKDVIQDYSTPEGTSLQRHLTTHLSYQIEFIKTGRPLALSMGNAIRWLKQRISLVPISSTDEEAKILLMDEIDTFIMEKIYMADKVIVQYANQHIHNGSKVLTFGHSDVLAQLFEYCSQDRSFEVFIIDSKPLFEGLKMVKRLSKFPKIKIHYCTLGALSNVLADSNIDVCFLGAHSMLSNGRLYSRVGTAMVSMACKNKSIPVLVCCESLKFSDKVQLDSVTQNELGDPNDLINTQKKKGYQLVNYLKELEQGSSNNNNNKQQQQQQQKKQKEQESTEQDDDLSNWNELQSLNILNILYDLTPPEYIQKIITEFGALPASSVPVVLREYKNTN